MNGVDVQTYQSLLLGRIAVLLRCGLLLQTSRSLSVSLSITIVSPANTTELIEMPFGMWTRVGTGNHVLEGGPHFQNAIGHLLGGGSGGLL